MTVYTNIQKPTSTSYSNTNTVGKQQYDQADLTYNATDVFYDGINQGLYTAISKPATTTYTLITKPS